MSQHTATAADIAHADAGHVHYDPVSNRIGMWLFLFTEVLLFGAMFLAYAVYLTTYRTEFQETSGNLAMELGAINTAVVSNLRINQHLRLDQRALRRSIDHYGWRVFIARKQIALCILGDPRLVNIDPGHDFLNTAFS